jgi:hypothetical protein
VLRITKRRSSRGSSAGIDGQHRNLRWHGEPHGHDARAQPRADEQDATTLSHGADGIALSVAGRHDRAAQQRQRHLPPCVWPAKVSATRAGTCGNTSGLCVSRPVVVPQDGDDAVARPESVQLSRDVLRRYEPTPHHAMDDECRDESRGAGLQRFQESHRPPGQAVWVSNRGSMLSQALDA